MTIPPFLLEQADKLVAAGHYESRDEVVVSAVAALVDRHEQDVFEEQARADYIAAIEAGLADIDAGRFSPAEEVFAELKARLSAIARDRSLAQAAE